MKRIPHTYSTRILGVFLLDQIADVGASQSRNIKLGLISHDIVLELWRIPT